MDEFHPYSNNVFQPSDEEGDDYGSSDSSSISPRDSLFSHVKDESSNTIIMPVMVTEAINLDEELANMKGTLERLSKESEEKNAQIKHQNKQIANLKKKLEKQLSEASNKSSSGKDSDKESNATKSLTMNPIQRMTQYQLSKFKT